MIHYDNVLFQNAIILSRVAWNVDDGENFRSNKQTT